MKKYVARCSVFFNFLFLLSTVSTVFADQVWVGASTPNVLNENLFIDGSAGDIILDAGPNFITAASIDVTVTVGNNPVVRGNGSGASQIILSGNTGRKITFQLQNNNLTFKGSMDVAQTPLLVYAKPGHYQVEFIMNGGRVLSFTSDTNSGGTLFFVETSGGAVPRTQVVFTRRSPDAAPNADVTTYIGPRSLMSFTSTGSLQDATMIFNASNAAGAQGRMTLSIDPTGGFIIRPHPVSYLTNPVIGSIAMAQLGQGSVTVQTVNSGSGHSGLQVVNNNDTLFQFMYDPFCTQGAREDNTNFIGTFDGIQYGYVLGANGILDIGDNSFVDYVGTVTNSCPLPVNLLGCDGTFTGTLIKERNTSAFIVDGSVNPLAVSAQILLGDSSALFFRSGVDKNGFVENPVQPQQFVVDPANKVMGAGNIVFDVEGPVRVKGSNSEDGSLLRSKIEVLSTEVTISGGPLFYNTSEIIFPRRTFAVDINNDPFAYSNACFLINNRLNLINTTLVHTDVNHKVFEKNDVKSEPTYIGGESFLFCTPERPKIEFYNSQLFVHSDIALTGVDLSVPDRVVLANVNALPAVSVALSNISKFVFFSNGRVVDSGTGRQMILGTQIGSTACGGCLIVSRDAHLDVMQDTDFSTALGGVSCAAAGESIGTLEDLATSTAGCAIITDLTTLDHTLLLDVAANTTVINNAIPLTDISNQFDVHTIYLGHSSNISVGTNADTTGFDNDTFPKLTIDGDFFSFETRGGPLGIPETSNVTGKGGMFVDLNGTVSINPAFRAYVAMMVTRSRNGVVDLPKNQVLFNNRVGVATWRVDLTAPSEQVLINPGEHFSDYTFNWIDIVKDFELFTPYVLDSVSSCTPPAVVSSNITPVPTILGRVEQLQITGSRLGDEAYVKIGNGGFVRELIFLLGNKSAEAPVGFVILENDSHVGIGSAHRTRDSLNGSIRLGINGVTIIANGNGVVKLNEDVEIDNICSILQGPDFSEGSSGVLVFTSDEPRTFTVKKTGILDLRSFSEGTTVEFGGQISIQLEPGARVHGNGVTLRLADDARMVVETFPESQSIFQANGNSFFFDQTLSPTVPPVAIGAPYNQFAPLGTTVGNATVTDPFRVKFIGNISLNLNDTSKFFIEPQGFMGIETYQEFTGTQTCCIDATNVQININDSAEFIVGTDYDEIAGSMQIGNTTDIPGHFVNFSLNTLSPNARFKIKSQGFLGFGVGIVDKQRDVPNQWIVDNLFNVASININNTDGLIAHDRIYDGDDVNASLIAIGQSSLAAPLYTFQYEPVGTVEEARAANAAIHGGGNIALIISDLTGPLHPVVREDDGLIDIGSGLTHSRLQNGILASNPLLPATGPVLTSATAFFNAAKTVNSFTLLGDLRAKDKSNLAEGVPAFRQAYKGIRAGFVLGNANDLSGTIYRFDIFDVDDNVLGSLPDESAKHAVEVGAANIKIADLNNPEDTSFFSALAD